MHYFSLRCVCVVFTYVFFRCEFYFVVFYLSNIMNKSIRYLNGCLILNEKICINYFQERNLLQELDGCYTLRDNVICGGTLKE